MWPNKDAITSDKGKPPATVGRKVKRVWNYPDGRATEGDRRGNQVSIVRPSTL
jgi:hypothetical protein